VGLAVGIGQKSVVLTVTDGQGEGLRVIGNSAPRSTGERRHGEEDKKNRLRSW